MYLRDISKSCLCLDRCLVYLDIIGAVRLRLCVGGGVVVAVDGWVWCCCKSMNVLYRSTQQVLILINELCHPSLTPRVESGALTTLTPPTQSVLGTLCLSDMKLSIKDDGFRQISVFPHPRPSPDIAPAAAERVYQSQKRMSAKILHSQRRPFFVYLPWDNANLSWCLHRSQILKVLEAAFNKEEAPVKLLTLRRFVSRSSVYCVWCGGVECNFIQSPPPCLCNDRREHVDWRNGDISQPSVTTISTLYSLHTHSWLLTPGFSRYNC